MRLSVFAAGLTAVSLACSAAELGSLSLVSRFGEPFDARLQLRDVQPGEAADVSLGTAAYYQKIGKKLVPEVTTLRIAPNKDARGRYRIQSDEAINLEAFPLILVLKSDGKLKAKVYNVKLAAPKSVSQNYSHETVSVDHKERVSSTAPIAPEKKAAQPLSSEPAVDKVASATVQESPKPKVVQKTSPSAVKQKKAATVPNRQASVRVKRGMTMWSIAGKVRGKYPRASMDQILVAFVRANPKAFEKGRVSGLKVGSVLRVPTASQVAKVTREEAHVIVRSNPEMSALKKLSSKQILAARKAMNEKTKESSKLVALPEASQPLSADGVQPKQEMLLEERNASTTQTTANATATPDQLSENQEKPVHAESGSSDSKEAAPLREDASLMLKNEQEKATSADKETPAVSDVRSEEAEKESGFSWKALFAAIFGIGIAAGAVYFVRRRQSKGDFFGRMKDVAENKPEHEAPVVFRDKPVETSKEQIDEIEKTVSRRMESDAYAQRGFELKGESFGLPARSEPTIRTENAEKDVLDQASALSEPTPEVKEEVVDGEAAKPEADALQAAIISNPNPTAERIEPTLGIDLGVRKEESKESEVQPTETVSVPLPSSDDMIEQKLLKARGLLEASLSDRAIELLEEIALKGDEKQRAAALKLLTEIHS